MAVVVGVGKQRAKAVPLAIQYCTAMSASTPDRSLICMHMHTHIQEAIDPDGPDAAEMR